MDAIGPQHPLHVVLAEPHAGLPQVLGAGPQQGHLAPGQAGRQDQRVEAVVFGLAVPQRGQGVLEDLPQAAGRGDGRGPQAEFIYPERTGARAPGELIGVLVDDLEAQVLQLRQDLGQRDRRARPVHHQRPSLRVLDQADRELLLRLAQPEHGGQVADRVGRRDVGLVGPGNERLEPVEQGPGPLLAEHPGRLGAQVLIPGPHRGGQPALQRGRVHLRHRPAALGPDHHVQPGQGRVADGRAVVNRRPVQRLPQDLLGAQPDLRRVPVPGQVHQAGHVPAVAVPAQEQPGLLALAQAQHAQRDRDELLGRDLEQLLPRVVLEDLGQILAVVAAGGQPGLGQHVGHLAPDHRDGGDGRGVRRVRIQAEEPELPGDRSVRAEPLDRDIVQVVGAVDGGPGVGLGQHQPLGRVLRPGRHLCGQLAQRVPAAPGVAEDAQAGARHGAQGGGAVGRPHQVVLAVAEEGEVAVGQPAQQVAGLGRLAARPARRDRPPAGAPPPPSGPCPRPRRARRRGPGAGPSRAAAR